MNYQVPLDEMCFALRSSGAMDAAAVAEMDEVLREAARLCEREIAPGNRASDLQGARCEEGRVVVPPEIVRSWSAYAEGGWIGLHAPSAFGGQGLPKAVQAAVTEMLNASNLALGSGLLLCEGAIEALLIAGSPAQRDAYIARLVSGTWSGTMNLTESQAGSDLAQVRTMATPDGTGWRLKGQKQFITFGEQDFTDNILHFVLARTPGAPEGVRGVSLFAVPKFLPSPERERVHNDIRCVSIEHKLGIRGSPTCVLAFGEQEGAWGELVGELHRGLDTMFLMMNAARFTVGLQGIGIAERAYQGALAYARERVQGRPIGWDGREVPTISRHPDVHRMLTSIAAQVQASRALAYFIAACIDSEDADQRALADLLVPVHKGHATELAVEHASTALQVFGGMGFIEESGIAQCYRDARILPIYEGTTAIQANDLVGRKTLRDGGATITRLLRNISDDAAVLATAEDASLASCGRRLSQAVTSAEVVVRWMLSTAASDPRAVYGASVPYLRLIGHVAGAWQMARGLSLAIEELATGCGDPSFLADKVAAAKFHLLWIAPQCQAIAQAIVDGAVPLMSSGDLS